jgi:hypothetical protein
MKSTTQILLFILSISSVFAQGDKKYSTKDSRYKFYSDFVKKYNSESIQEIWNNDKGKYFDDYVDDNSEKEMVKSWSTVIHELLHGYNESSIKGHTYFIEKGIRIEVPFTEVYNSKELNKTIRKGLQDSIFRYHLYIGGKNDLLGFGKVKGVNDSKQNEAMSIQKGIYGLLEEFSAYYYGNLAAYEQKKYYLKTYGEKNPDAWKSYKHEVESDLVAYYEFQLFMAWYMNLAKEKFPKVYEGIHKNQAFKVVYTLISDKYFSLVTKAEAELKLINKEEKNNNVMDLLDFSGSDDDFINFLLAAGLEQNEVYEETLKLVNGKTVKAKKIILDKEISTMMRKEYDNVVKTIGKELGTKNKGESDLLLFHSNTNKQLEFLKNLMNPKLENELKKLKIETLTVSNYLNFLK